MKNLSLTLGLWVLGAAMCVAEPIELNLSSPESTHKVKFYEKKSVSGEADFDEELRILNRVRKNQEECYKSDLEYMIRETENIINSLKKIQQMAGKE